MESGGEINNFMKLWLSIIISLCYCYSIGKIFPKGTVRLLCLLPVISLFIFIPLNISSIHLGATTALFITWLANFKLLLFAIGKGPLSSSSLSLPRFLAVACFPIKIQQNPSAKSHLNGHNKEIPGSTKPKKGYLQTPLNYAIKIVLFALLLRVYDYSEYIHPTIILFLYYYHMYFCLEIILAMVAAVVRTLLGLELEQQFNEPYLSTSLQDFWGRRWNIMVTSILRVTVYEPVLNMGASFVGRKWAQILAVFGTFVVSGVMHELIFFYLGRVKPTWEITWFFLLHGTCLMGEITLKKAFGDKWRLPRVVSTPLTLGFLELTGLWLFFPQLLRCRAYERAIEEYAALGAFLKNVSGLTFSSFQFQS
ncbi:hypothetical protein REPUB_Repub13aG0275900 [Reevesia pubescens]